MPATPASRWPLPVSFDAAERQVHLGADGRRVDVEDAGVHVAHGHEGLVDVARVDRRRQAVLHAVADLDRLLRANRSGITAVTGPKISSCAMRMSGFTSANTVGWWKKPFAYVAVASAHAPPATTLRAFVACRSARTSRPS